MTRTTRQHRIFKGTVRAIIKEGRLQKNGCRYVQFLADDKVVVSVIGPDVQYFLSSNCVGLRFEAGGKKKGERNFTASWLVVWGVDPFPSYLRMKKYGSLQEYNRQYRQKVKKREVRVATEKRTMAELAIERAETHRQERLEREARTRALFDKLIAGCKQKQSPMLQAAMEGATVFEEVIAERNKLQQMLDDLSEKVLKVK